MWVAGLKVWGWVKRIPVLFAHFPGPALLLAAILLGAGVSIGGYFAAKFSAAKVAELRAEFAEARAAYAERGQEHAEKREQTIASAAATQRAIDLENQRAWRESLTMLAESDDDKAALAALNTSIERLHNDPAFECRRRALPDDYLRGVWLPAWPSAGSAGRP
jgi:hypothetical protein